MPDQDDEPTPEQTDEFMNMNVLLPRGEGYQQSTICHRKRNSSGKTIGKRIANTFLNTRVYEAEFPDVKGVAISADTVTTSLFGKCLYDEHDLMLFKSLLDHKSDMTEFQRYDAFVKRNGSNSERKKTNRGWQLLFEWFDGTMTWEKLSDLKEFYPVQVAEYASGNIIIDEPTFAWWARYIIKKRRAILSKVKAKYWSRTHKYGFRVPKYILLRQEDYTRRMGTRFGRIP